MIRNYKNSDPDQFKDFSSEQYCFGELPEDAIDYENRTITIDEVEYNMDGGIYAPVIDNNKTTNVY